MVASSSGTNLTLPDRLQIDEVTTQAFEVLGDHGIIHSSTNHTCAEFSQPYKATADVISADDPAAVIGIDEHRVVPAREGPDAPLAVRDAAAA